MSTQNTGNEKGQSNFSGDQANAVQSSQPDNNIAGDNTIKNPDDWKTGDEPMTGAQKSYLSTLASEAHEEVNEDLTKAEASKKIDELQHKTGRGLENE